MFAKLSGLFSQDGQIFCDDAPDELYIDSEILVHQNISESSNLLPWDFRLTRLILSADASGRFCQYLQIADYGILNQEAVHETIARGQIAQSTDIFVNSMNAIENVVEIKQIGLQWRGLRKPLKSHCLAQHGVAKPGMQGTLGRHVNPHSEFRFQIGNKAARKERRANRPGLDQKIEIAAWPCVPSREGPEDSNPRDPVSRRDSSNRRAFFDP